MSTFPPVLSSLVCVLALRGLWPFLVLRVPPYNLVCVMSSASMSFYPSLVMCQLKPFSRGMSADLYVVLGISTRL
ncbi:hypothetical protein BC629DRAFT_1575872 [Irpex lacteus]|nr:hypothetical protein BC629DRAFT_1575872 [Irpex lacteus]